VFILPPIEVYHTSLSMMFITHGLLNGVSPIGSGTHSHRFCLNVQHNILPPY